MVANGSSFRTWRDGCLESVMRSKADIGPSVAHELELKVRAACARSFSKMGTAMRQCAARRRYTGSLWRPQSVEESSFAFIISGGAPLKVAQKQLAMCPALQSPLA
jgi:hypothetical protein